MKSALFWMLVLAFQAPNGCATVNTQQPALVEYRRSGGIAGREDRLVVHADGSMELSRRGAAVDFTVGGDTLAQLRTILERVPLDSLRDEYVPPRGGADLYEHVLVFGNRRIRAVDTAVPPELQPLIQLLGSLANRR